MPSETNNYSATDQSPSVTNSNNKQEIVEQKKSQSSPQTPPQQSIIPFNLLAEFSIRKMDINIINKSIIRMWVKNIYKNTNDEKFLLVAEKILSQVQDQNSSAQQSQNLLLEICKLLIQNSPISRDEKIAFKFTYQLYQLVFYDLYFVSTDTHYLFYKKCSEEVKDAFREKRQDIEINELYTQQYSLPCHTI